MENFDTVVVGAGPGGLMAALRATKNGHRVALVEKEKCVGGTARGSVYGVWIPQNRLLKSLGIREDKEQCLKWMCKHAYPKTFDKNAIGFGIPSLDYAMFSQYFDSSSKMLDFLMDESGLSICFMRNHADDFDTYDANRNLLREKNLPVVDDLIRALPDYHPEDEFNQVPVGRYVNVRTDLKFMIAHFMQIFRSMDIKVLISGLLELTLPQSLWRSVKGFIGRYDEGAFY